MDDAIFAYWAKAPGHLNGIAVPAGEEQIRAAQEAYGAFSTVFAIQLPPGSMLFRSFDEEEENSSNRIWVELPDKREFVLHDPLEHGYEGQLGISFGDDGSTGKRLLMDPLSQKLELVLCFQYNGDEAEMLEDGNSENIQDYYSWLAIYRDKDGKLEEVISIECA